jgi:uncharacterized protein
LYRHIILLSSIVAALLSGGPLAHADPERCQELRRRFEIAKPQISAMEVSLTLFSASDGNCIAMATELLDHGASVDARDRFGARALSHAARFGHLQMVDLLLTRDAPINARNLAGATALFFAAEGSHTLRPGLSNTAPTSRSLGAVGFLLSPLPPMRATT